MTTTLALILSVPLLFQPVAARLCLVNQITQGGNDCYQVTPSIFPAVDGGFYPDMEWLDITGRAYYREIRIDASTTFNFEDDASSGTPVCSEWLDEDSSVTVTCPEVLN